MSLSSEKAAAKLEFKTLLENMLTRENTSIDEFTDRLFDTMEAWLKKATIKYNTGLMAPNGAVTGTFNGKLE